jgi:broad specificity phosphatase PhoE
LVRHAHAPSRKEWAGDDRFRPLSPQGLKQAGGLAPVAKELAPAIRRVLSSPSLRCVQTVEPLAEVFGLPVEQADELSEGQRAAAVKLVRSLAGQDAAVCTHGDVVAEILVSLADEDCVDLGPHPRQAKGSIWVLEGQEGRFSSARYIPPVVAETV